MASQKIARVCNVAILMVNAIRKVVQITLSIRNACQENYMMAAQLLWRKRKAVLRVKMVIC